MTTNPIATLPPATHVSIIRKTLEAERRNREHAFRFNTTQRLPKVAEIDSALESLQALEVHLRE